MGDRSFPKYLMVIGSGKRKKRMFLSLGEAAAAYDSGFAQVDFGEYVLRRNFSVRPMTEKDKEEISEAADEYSANK